MSWVQSCIISNECISRTVPCTHAVDFTYADGTKVRFYFNAVEICHDLREYLTDENKEHFAYMRRLRRTQNAGSF